MGAFFINRTERFLKNPSLYGNAWGAVELSPEKHIDIDTPEELELAKKMLLWIEINKPNPSLFMKQGRLKTI